MIKLRDRFSRQSKPAPSHPADSLDVFASEESPEVWAAPLSRRIALNRWHPRLLVPIAILASVGIGGYLVQKWRPFDVEAASASLTIESHPVGADVLAAGVKRGRTPLTLSVAPGEHTFELVFEGRRKPFRTVAKAGMAVVHHVQLEPAAPPAPPAPATASLAIVTEPDRQPVVLDGRRVGSSPVRIRGLEPGLHKVRVGAPAGQLERTVEVKSGEQASLIIQMRRPSTPSPASAAAPIRSPSASTRIPPPKQVPASAPAKAVKSSPPIAPMPVTPTTGWVTITSPILVQILKGGEIVGTSRTPRIVLPVGRHELQLLNEELGVTATISVDVLGGKSTTVLTDVPSVPLTITAVPWAEVWIAGKRIGGTPIGNHQVPVGTHEVVFRHPELGERRQSVTVTARTPARLSVDMRKPE